MVGEPFFFRAFIGCTLKGSYNNTHASKKGSEKVLGGWFWGRVLRRLLKGDSLRGFKGKEGFSERVLRKGS